MRKLRTGSQTWWWGVHTLLQVDSEKEKQREREIQRWSWGNSCWYDASGNTVTQKKSCSLTPGPLCSQRLWVHSDDFYTSLYLTVLSGLFMTEYPIIITLFTSLFKHFIHLCMYFSHVISLWSSVLLQFIMCCVWSCHKLCAVSHVRSPVSLSVHLCVFVAWSVPEFTGWEVKQVVSNFSARANSKAGVRGQINQPHTLTHIYICLTPSLGHQQSIYIMC